MNKIKIQFLNRKWRLTLPTKMFFEFDKREEMIKALDQFTKDFKRLEKALHIIFYLDDNKLTEREFDMIHRIQCEMKCSKKQYGWLKGIQERQHKNTETTGK